MSQVSLRVWRYQDGFLREEVREVAVEHVLTLVVNSREWVSLLCSPDHLLELGVGYLFSEGILTRKDDIEGMRLDQDRGILRLWVKGADELLELSFKRVITSGCGRGASFRTPLDLEAMVPINSSLILESGRIFQFSRDFQRSSDLWRTTHGVHGCALFNTERIILFRHDIGRHNAVDKVLGYCFLKGVSTQEKGLLCSGRISSEMILKAIKARIPVILSLSSATDQAVELAKRFGITLVGFTRARSFVIYSHPGRIKAQ